MATFEGPMLSLKRKCNCAFHGLDYTRSRWSFGLEWFMAFGMIYWLVPRMSKGPCFQLNYQTTLIGTLGILYTLPCMLQVLQASNVETI
jgi:cytochrome c oxidase cbb3-type subunit I/II